MIFHVLSTALHTAAQWPADRTLQFTVERCLIIITSNPSSDDGDGDGEPSAAANKIIIIMTWLERLPAQTTRRYLYYPLDAGAATDELHSDDLRPETLLSVIPN